MLPAATLRFTIAERDRITPRSLAVCSSARPIHSEDWLQWWDAFVTAKHLLSRSLHVVAFEIVLSQSYVRHLAWCVLCLSFLGPHAYIEAFKERRDVDLKTTISTINIMYASL